ncbi:MAG: class I tRNA ligase family protein [Candidatus Liptonbacteria bacterium]|nr:class I tRNA ligase family protein [Candidatus Liptonbacteria bacterium]
MKQKGFATDKEGFNLPRLEERVLDFWKERHIFEKSLAIRKRGRKFVFFEGPPTANGKPGIHHVLARVFKDAILRYRTMRGFSVPRRSGWDTHGLPVELQVEKELGLKSKRDIEQYGMAAFNRKCRESVWRHKDEFEKLTERIGFWLDLEHPYVTYDKGYIESLWFIIQQFWKKGLLYQGHKVVPWCPRCGTALSSHEMALGYRSVTEDSVFLKFRLLPGQKFGSYTTKDNAFILSWTTTPWTLPGNLALAVGNSIKYQVSRDKENGEVYIFAEGLAEQILPGGKLEPLALVTGKDLVGLTYQPLFSVPPLHKEKAYRVYPADFVSTTDGTGVVHTAVMYGEDDYRLGVELGLPQHHTVDETGRFTSEVAGLAGRIAKNKETDEAIFEHLREHNNLLRITPYTHEYPHCWRCDTPLLYYARSSWFVAVSKLRAKLIAENKKIHWVPGHIKNGRFGEWLKEAKDWNFSRERYWGTPLPIWQCHSCGETKVIGSYAELDRLSGGSRNQYWVMRHGFAETNLLGIHDVSPNRYPLTPQGETKVRRVAEKLRPAKIDLVVFSDVERTRETAKIVAKYLGDLPTVSEPRLREIDLGKYDGHSSRGYHQELPTYTDKFARGPEGGESLRQVRARVWAVLADLERKYHGKKILLVSHEYSIWMIRHVAEGWNEAEAIMAKEKKRGDFIAHAEVQPLALRITPRDETGEADPHRPYIDGIKLPCPKCHRDMTRVKEVADVWFDSGAMPYASEKRPFQSEERRAKSEKSRIAPPSSLLPPRSSLLAIPYPADYICEAVDQTRGWFYTLLAIATLLGLETPYRHVICLGHINDKHGQKMSKSKGNIVDPWEMAGKHGIDSVRWYFFTMNPPGEPKNFDQLELAKTYRRFHLILWNCLEFWRTYAGKATSDERRAKRSKNVLDMWILARLQETIAGMTDSLEKYEIREAGLLLESLTDDLSRWYIRRSRRRLQRPESQADFAACSAVLGHVLTAISKLLAPFTPFFAEAMYASVMGHGSRVRKESVHLEDWPRLRQGYGGQAGKAKREEQKGKSGGRETPPRSSLLAPRLLFQMAEIRRIASLALAERAKLGIKVRQPLRELRIKNKELRGRRELLAILAEEVNVKEVVVDPKMKTEIELDTKITPELKAEGLLREFVRVVQELRASAGYRPQDRITLWTELPAGLRAVVMENEAVLKRETGLKRIEYRKTTKFDAEISSRLEEADVWLAIRRT